MSDPAYSATLPLKFIGASSTNVANVQAFNLPWAADATTFTDIGEKVNPALISSPTLGILLDMNHLKGGGTGAVLTPKKYMKMKVNLQRFPHTTDDNVEIILTYSWLPPSRTLRTGLPYLTREIRTIRSSAPSY